MLSSSFDHSSFVTLYGPVSFFFLSLIFPWLVLYRFYLPVLQENCRSHFSLGLTHSSFSSKTANFYHLVILFFLKAISAHYFLHGTSVRQNPTGEFLSSCKKPFLMLIVLLVNTFPSLVTSSLVYHPSISLLITFITFFGALIHWWILSVLFSSQLCSSIFVVGFQSCLPRFLPRFLAKILLFHYTTHLTKITMILSHLLITFNIILIQ